MAGQGIGAKSGGSGDRQGPAPSGLTPPHAPLPPPGTLTRYLSWLSLSSSPLPAIAASPGLSPSPSAVPAGLQIPLPSFPSKTLAAWPCRAAKTRPRPVCPSPLPGLPCQQPHYPLTYTQTHRHTYAHTHEDAHVYQTHIYTLTHADTRPHCSRSCTPQPCSTHSTPPVTPPADHRDCIGIGGLPLPVCGHPAQRRVWDNPATGNSAARCGLSAHQGQGLQLRARLQVRDQPVSLVGEGAWRPVQPAWGQGVEPLPPPLSPQPARLTAGLGWATLLAAGTSVPGTDAWDLGPCTLGQLTLVCEHVCMSVSSCEHMCEHACVNTCV